MRKTNFKYIYILIIISLQNITSFAQNSIPHLNYSLVQNETAFLIKNQTKQHYTFKSYLWGLDDKENDDTIHFSSKTKLNYVFKKIFTDNFIEVNKPKFHIIINPLFNISTSKEQNENKSFTQNTRGFSVSGKLGKYIRFYTCLLENQATFPNFTDSYIRKSLVVPGQGARKDFKENGHDFSQSMGHIEFLLSKYFNLQLGTGKHFIGDGYRSLLLSDNAFSYPFLKLNFKFHDFQYTMLFAELNQFENEYYNYHHKKHYSITWFSWLPTKNTEISLFEGIIWKSADSITSRKIPVDFYKPIIFARLLNYSLNDADNFLFGLNIRHNFYRKFQAYGQLLIDNANQSKLFKLQDYKNRYAGQLGIKAFDFIPLQKIHYYLNLEFNIATPYTYSHNTPLQAYTHHNQPLAHPIGGGFKEFVAIACGEFKNFRIKYSFVNATSSHVNDSVNHGSNLFLSDFSENTERDNRIGQGQKYELTSNSLTFSYILNKKTRYEIFLSILSRKEKYENQSNDYKLFTFGFRTNIFNHYYDF